MSLGKCRVRTKCDKNNQWSFSLSALWRLNTRCPLHPTLWSCPSVCQRDHVTSCHTKTCTQKSLAEHLISSTMQSRRTWSGFAQFTHHALGWSVRSCHLCSAVTDGLCGKIKSNQLKQGSSNHSKIKYICKDTSLIIWSQAVAPSYTIL